MADCLTEHSEKKKKNRSYQSPDTNVQETEDNGLSINQMVLEFQSCN